MLFSTPKFRKVACLHCHRPFAVPDAATILTCPHCARRCRVDDVVVSRELAAQRVETCGKIIVRRTGRLVASVVQSGLGIEVQGIMDARQVACPSVLIEQGARWRGDLRTGHIRLMPGADILGGRFQIDPRLRTGATHDALSV